MTNAKTNTAAYDAVIVLGGNIRRQGNLYAPSTYADSDQYGMLGGKIRVIAAALQYLNGQCSIFVFSTGTSEKTKAALGPEVPTEAEVYSKDFLATVSELQPLFSGSSESPPEPELILEDISQNTVGNIRECFAIIQAHPEWQRVAFLSTWPHLGRTEALCELMGYKDSSDKALFFLSAEDVATGLQPGKYESEIEAAYASVEGQKRIASEAKGIQDIKSGAYVMTEYQLHEKELAPLPSL